MKSRLIQNTATAAVLSLFVSALPAKGSGGQIWAPAARAATAASIDQQAEDAPLTLNWKYYKSKDQMLKNAAEAQPGWKMVVPQDTSYRLYTSFTYGISNSEPYHNGISPGRLTIPVGHPVKAGAFTDAQLASVGVTRTVRYISGYLMTKVNRGDSKAAYLQLIKDKQNPSQDLHFSGWPQSRYPSLEEGQADYKSYYFHYIHIPYNSLSHSPETVAKRLKAKL